MWHHPNSFWTSANSHPSMTETGASRGSPSSANSEKPMDLNTYLVRDTAKLVRKSTQSHSDRCVSAKVHTCSHLSAIG